MPRQTHNVGPADLVIEKRHFAMLDALPLEIQRVIKNSPYEFAVGEVNDYYNRLRGAGMSQDQAVSTVIGKWETMVARMIVTETIRVYGPDHPQARQ